MATPILDADNINAVITTRWEGGTYIPYSIRQIEGYTIETNMDEDSDPWTMTVGDITGEFSDLLKRDNEIRVQIFGIGTDINYLMTGLVDSAVRTADGRITMQGRDLSSIATDTIAEPISFKHMRASTIIEQRARTLRCAPRIALTPTNVLGKISTDGSETEWEFWYRFIRRAAQWLWYEPDGTLKSGKLNYDAEPTYFLGEPPNGDNNPGVWIPVETGEFHSSKQGRIYKAVVIYHDGSSHQPQKDFDPLIVDWLRKPVKLFEQKDIHKAQAALNFVRDEIKESIIGLQEIKLTIPDPGVLIRQNNMARLNVPDLGLAGDWFIVGTRIIADEGGFTQEVRLREKNYAISARVPPDPVVSQEPSTAVTSGVGKGLSIPKHPDWGDFFVAAAKRWHGNHEMEWFLAVLLGICEDETGFTNERAHNSGGSDGAVYLPGVHGVEWFEWPLIVTTPVHGISNLLEYRLSFGNDPGGPQVFQAAVGPMQLYSIDLKKEADDIIQPGNHDQFTGGRWQPEANIMVAAHYLHDLCVKYDQDVADNEQIWKAVAAYYGADWYAEKIKPLARAWYQTVKEAFTQSATDFQTAQDALGPAKQIASGLLDAMFANPPTFRDDQGGAIKDQLYAVKTGQRIQSPCPELGMITIDPKVLNACALLLSEGIWVGSFCFITGHDCHSDDGPISKHSRGLAVDISSLGTKEIGWKAIGSDDSKSLKDLMIRVLTIFKGQTQGVLLPNQLICNGLGGHEDAVLKSMQLSGYAATNYVTSGHMDHIHVGY